MVIFRIIMDALFAIIINYRESIPPGESNSIMNLTTNELCSSPLLSLISFVSSALVNEMFSDTIAIKVSATKKSDEQMDRKQGVSRYIIGVKTYPRIAFSQTGMSIRVLRF